MDWDKIRIFHAVAEAGSFTKAARALNMSQPAVSRKILNFEEELNVVLFRRQNRGVTLTEQGELLHSASQEISTQLRNVTTRLSDSQDQPHGNLCITTTVGLGVSWLTPRLNEFRQRYPEIQMRLILSDTEVDILNGEADGALRLHKPEQLGLVMRKLFTVHLHAYVSKHYLKQYGDIQTIEDLDQHHILSFEGGDQPYEELNWLEHTGLKGKKRKTALIVNNLFALKQAVSTGMGVAILPDYMVVHDENIVRVLKDADVPKLTSYFVYPEELRNSRRLKVFKEFVASKAKEWSD